MPFNSFDSLRLFGVVARHLSFTAAAEELNLTKGAISYQISKLEKDLGFLIFIRRPRGITLTPKGGQLLNASRLALRELTREITTLQDNDQERITIGMSTYFASRWLSPRLMNFIAHHPKIGLRIQPLIDLIDLRAQKIDMAIRWGKGQWRDMEIEPLLPCPAFPTASASVAAKITELGLEAALPEIPLMHDYDGSVAWRDWHHKADLPYRTRHNDLVIPDPNVRVQSVIDGQGLALNDNLVEPELAAGILHKISNLELAEYGYYLAYPKGSLSEYGLKAFRDWVLAEAG